MVVLCSPEEENDELSVVAAEGLPGVVGRQEDNADEAEEVKRTRRAVTIKAEEKWPADVKQP